MRIPMFERTREEFQYLKEWDKNSSVWKDNKNSNVSKDKIRILMFGRIK